jgi:hypothetical protein
VQPPPCGCVSPRADASPSKGCLHAPSLYINSGVHPLNQSIPLFVLQHVITHLLSSERRGTRRQRQVGLTKAPARQLQLLHTWRSTLRTVLIVRRCGRRSPHGFRFHGRHGHLTPLRRTPPLIPGQWPGPPRRHHR